MVANQHLQYFGILQEFLRSDTLINSLRKKRGQLKIF